MGLADLAPDDENGGGKEDEQPWAEAGESFTIRIPLEMEVDVRVGKELKDYDDPKLAALVAARNRAGLLHGLLVGWGAHDVIIDLPDNIKEIIEEQIQ